LQSTTRRTTLSAGALSTALLFLCDWNHPRAQSADHAEIVLHTIDATVFGLWSRNELPGVASGFYVGQPDRGAPKVPAPPGARKNDTTIVPKP
jgi:hypothetical protein